MPTNRPQGRDQHDSPDSIRQKQPPGASRRDSDPDQPDSRRQQQAEQPASRKRDDRSKFTPTGNQQQR